jgi:hypothetical protein
MCGCVCVRVLVSVVGHICHEGLETGLTAPTNTHMPCALHQALPEIGGASCMQIYMLASKRRRHEEPGTFTNRATFSLGAAGSDLLPSGCFTLRQCHRQPFGAQGASYH